MNAKFMHHQIDTYIVVKCECGHVILDTLKTVNLKEKSFYPLTMLLVYCMMLLGVGYAGADKLISFLSLQHFTQNTFIRYAKHITKNALIHTSSILEKSRVVVYQHYAKKQEIIDGKVNVSATYDGSWHKRGHKSNFGVGAVIDVDCGLVLDYHMCSKICSKCTAKVWDLKNKKITETEYIFWLEEEHADCDENYDGSSGGMEASAALELWGRSTDYGMEYRTFVSDCDSSAYRAVCDMNGGKGPYGEGNKVEKAECINHVAK